MSQTSNLGAQLGFPLGFNSVSGGSLTKAVSDALSLSDSILLTNPVIPESASDILSLSDSIAFTLSSTFPIRLTQIVAEVVTEDAATATIRLTQIVAEVVTEIFPSVTELVSDTLSLSDSIAFILVSTIITAESVSDTLSLSDSIALYTYPAIPGVTQVLIEVATHPPPALIVTQAIVEWTRNPHPNLFVTQSLIEWAIHPPNSLIATQVCIEVAYKPQNGPVKAHYKRFLPIGD